MRENGRDGGRGRKRNRNFNVRETHGLVASESAPMGAGEVGVRVGGWEVGGVGSEPETKVSALDQELNKRHFIV